MRRSRNMVCPTPPAGGPVLGRPLVVVSLISRAAGSDYSNSFSLPKTESADAINLLEAASPTVSGDVDQIVFTASGPGVRNPAVVDRINSMLAREAKVPHVSNIVSPYGPQGATHVSKDGKVAFATVTFDKQAQNLSTDHRQGPRHDGAVGRYRRPQVAVSGNSPRKRPGRRSEGRGSACSWPPSCSCLVFGSLFAMALPLISALARSAPPWG